MEPLEHVIRSIVANNFCNRVVEAFENNPEIETSIDEAFRKKALENYQKLAERDNIPSEIQDEYKKQVQKMTVGKHYFSKHCLGTTMEWTEGKEMQESYLKEMDSLIALKTATMQTLGFLSPDSLEYLENTQILQKIDDVESKLALYTSDLFRCLERKNNIIDTLTKQKKEPGDEDIRIAVTKEILTPEDYVQNFRKGFEASSKYHQLMIDLRHENDPSKLLVNINDSLMIIFEKYFIKAHTDWLYNS